MKLYEIVGNEILETEGEYPASHRNLFETREEAEERLGRIWVMQDIIRDAQAHAEAYGLQLMVGHDGEMWVETLGEPGAPFTADSVWYK